jgi:hypothetical protein
MGCPEDGNEDFIKICDEIDRLSIYDDIPIEERIHEVQIERNDETIEAIHNRVVECRAWMNENLFKI